MKKNFYSLENKNSQNLNLAINLNSNSIGGPSVSYYSSFLKSNNTNLLLEQENVLSEKEKRTKLRYYTVLPGDNIFSIAKKFEVTQQTIIIENKIKKGLIHPGDKLTILPVSGLRYTVKKGDTLSKIADKYSVKVTDITSYSDLNNTNILKVGEKIMIPGGTLPKEEEMDNNSLKAVSSIKYRYSKGKRKMYLQRGRIRIITPRRIPGRYQYTQTDYGYFTHPAPGSVRTQGVHGRNGVDIASYGAKHVPIYAAASGVVIKSLTGCIEGYTNCGGRYGNYVMVRHSNGLVTMYAHLSRLLVSRGEIVKKGQQIGNMGNTGKSTGVHLHFEVRGGYNPF